MAGALSPLICFSRAAISRGRFRRSLYRQVLVAKHARRDRARNSPLKKVKFDASLMETIDFSEGFDVPPAALVFGENDVDEAVVDIAGAKSRSDDWRAFDLAEFVSRREGSRQLRQDVINVGRALPGPQDGRVRQRRIEAVEMPVQTAGAAWDDGPILRRRELAVVANDRVALRIPQLEKVWGILLLVLPLAELSRVSLTHRKGIGY